MQAEMAVGLPTGEGSNMAYHVHVLWLCADKGGKQTVLVPGSVPQVVFAASEFLATYSYSPAKKHISLVDHNVVYGLVRTRRSPACASASSLMTESVLSRTCPLQ